MPCGDVKVPKSSTSASVFGPMGQNWLRSA